MGSVLVEYAKTGRSACKGCGLKIERQGLRIGISKVGTDGFKLTRWHHPPCFFKDAERSSIAIDSWEGIGVIKATEKEQLMVLARECEVEPGSSVSPSGKAENEISHNEASSSASKKQKTSAQSAAYDEGLWRKKLSSFTHERLSKSILGARLPEGWTSFETVIVSQDPSQPQGSPKIAAFDFDGCLVDTDVRRIGADAWKLLYPTVPDKLAEYHKDGYKIVIFTNEANISRFVNARQRAVDSKLGRLEGFRQRVSLPMQFFVACGGTKAGDPCRKPAPGMWELLEAHFNDGVAISRAESFFVGDAAGRPGDHSSSDKGFAEAVGLRFLTPEAVFRQG